jgi:hypothetical protein
VRQFISELFRPLALSLLIAGGRNAVDVRTLSSPRGELTSTR